MFTTRLCLYRPTYTALRNWTRSSARRSFHTSRPHTVRTRWWHSSIIPIAVGVSASCCVLLSTPLARLDSPSSTPLTDVQKLHEVLKSHPLADMFNNLAANYFAAPPEKQQEFCAVIAFLWLYTMPRRLKEGWQPTEKDEKILFSAVRLLKLYGPEKLVPEPNWRAKFAETDESMMKNIAAVTGSSWTGAPPASEDLKTTFTGFQLAIFMLTLSQGTSDAFHDPDEISDNGLGEDEPAEAPAQSEFMTLLSPSERILVCQGLKQAFNVMQKAKADPGERAALDAEYLQLGIRIGAEGEEGLEHAAKLAVHFEDLTRKQIVEAMKKVVVVNDRKVWPNPLS